MFMFSGELYSACAANTRTWQPDTGTTTWNQNNNWTPRNFPNTTTENAFIISDWRVPQFPNSNFSLSCFEISSGTMTASTGARTLTIAKLEE